MKFIETSAATNEQRESGKFTSTRLKFIYCGYYCWCCQVVLYFYYYVVYDRDRRLSNSIGGRLVREAKEEGANKVIFFNLSNW